MDMCLGIVSRRRATFPWFSVLLCALSLLVLTSASAGKAPTIHNVVATGYLIALAAEAVLQWGIAAGCGKVDILLYRWARGLATLGGLCIGALAVSPPLPKNGADAWFFIVLSVLALGWGLVRLVRVHGRLDELRRDPGRLAVSLGRIEV